MFKQILKNECIAGKTGDPLIFISFSYCDVIRVFSRLKTKMAFTHINYGI